MSDPQPRIPNDSEALGLIDLLQLVMSHPERQDYMDRELRAALEYITELLYTRNSDFD